MMSTETDNLKDRCKDFITYYDTIEKQPFSKDMLKTFRACGLTGWMIPASYGGQEKTARDMILAGETLMISCENLGIVLSWVIHEIVTTWFIYGFGTDQQRQTYIPQLVEGQLLGSVAISEPDVGPHPKLLKTFANANEHGFCLNGEKTYLTNGPIADVYIVIAISEIKDNRKHYSAYIVTDENKGFSRTSSLTFPFVQTSPHGGIIMKNCQVSDTHLLGESNTAYEKMVKPFREIEDTLMMGPIIGGMHCQLNRTIDHINQFQLSLNNELLTLLGNLKTHIITSRVIALEAAKLLDQQNQSEKRLALLLGFRHWAESFQNYFERLWSQLSIKNEQVSRLTNDLCGIGKVAMKIMLTKQMNMGKKSLLKGK